MPVEHQHQQQGVGATGFALQLVQRGLEESLGAVQRAIHEEVQNLHLELLRQFHIQQVTRLLRPLHFLSDLVSDRQFTAST